MRSHATLLVLLSAAGACGFSTCVVGAPRALATTRASPPLLQEPEYDLGRPTFDLLEWRSFRRETVLRYTLINRSEQLRIIFFGSSALASLGAPYLLGELLYVDGLPEYRHIHSSPTHFPYMSHPILPIYQKY